MNSIHYDSNGEDFMSEEIDSDRKFNPGIKFIK
jgi:hypothetical protein